MFGNIRAFRNSAESPLLRLPPELRNMIYKHVLGEYLIAAREVQVGKVHEELDYVGYRFIKLLQMPNELRIASRDSEVTLPRLDATFCALALGTYFLKRQWPANANVVIGVPPSGSGDCIAPIQAQHILLRPLHSSRI